MNEAEWFFLFSSVKNVISHIQRVIEEGSR